MGPAADGPEVPLTAEDARVIEEARARRVLPVPPSNQATTLNPRRGAAGASGVLDAADGPAGPGIPGRVALRPRLPVPDTGAELEAPRITVGGLLLRVIVARVRRRAMGRIGVTTKGRPSRDIARHDVRPTSSGPVLRIRARRASRPADGRGRGVGGPTLTRRPAIREG